MSESMLSASRTFEGVWWLRNRGYIWGGVGDEAREGGRGCQSGFCIRLRSVSLLLIDGG